MHLLKDLKYILAYIIPLSALATIHLTGVWTFLTVVIAFFFIPVIELFVPKSGLNITNEEEELKKNRILFDGLLYLNIPLVYVVFYLFVSSIHTETHTLVEYLGITLSTGIVLGSSGINVAHELGHRNTWYEKLFAFLLLLPSLYTHFTLEHNFGHHKNVATPDDPATARKGENMYAFWVKSVAGSYRNAWILEINRLKKAGLGIYSLKNKMVIYTISQLILLWIILVVFGYLALMFAVLAGICSFLLLETINYIEHYGLTRKILPDGRYERVSFEHSWNSNHELGRIMLYELTRHSDHHYKEQRKYQVLRHFDKSPQLPFGYPGSMILALFPPLWFKVMDPLL